METILLNLARWAMTHAPDAILLVLTLVVIPFFVRWAREKLTREHLATLSILADVAYDVVDGIARKTPGKLDDKAALALKTIRDQLKVKLSPADEARVQALLEAKHAQRKR